MDHQWGRVRLLDLRCCFPVTLHVHSLPFRAVSWADSHSIHGVDFLQSAILGLHHEEVDDDSESKAGEAKDETVEVMDIVGDEGSEERDQEVEEPV